MNAREPDRDDLLADLLVMFDEQLAEGTAARQVDTSSIADPADLPPEWERGRRCLELLHRVRREWSPEQFAEGAEVSGTDAAAAGETPSPGLRKLVLETPYDPAGTVLGRFRILRELGRGGLGIVYLAYDPQLRRQVALKVPRLEALANPDMRRRFLLEAEAAARLNHPHLVGIYDSGEDGPICYIAAEFCPGPTLDEWIKNRPGAVPIATGARIVKQLAEAVQHAHGRGVLHRDLKPSNVLMCLPEGKYLPAPSSGSKEADALLPKLTDFGMAKLLESAADHTRTGALVGTPAYMAPEQARGEVRDVDARADVYSLGAILYEVLTGRRTFPGESDVDALRQVLFEEPLAPRKLRKQIPRDLETICLKALAKDARQRYQTAGEMADDLGRFLEHEPILARRVHPIEKSWRWLKRRPLVVALLMLAVVAAAALASARRLSSENYALQGYREVTFTTEPPGAELAIVRLSDQNREPDPTQVTRPPGRTPLKVQLKPGDYLVVAALDKQRFHEVFRRVPAAEDSVNNSMFPHLDWETDKRGSALLPTIQIPSAVDTEDMAAVPCPDLATANEKQLGKGPVLFVDCHESTTDSLSRQLKHVLADGEAGEDLMRIFRMYPNYDRSVKFAEALGKRLPSEAEFECIAAAYESAVKANSVDPATLGQSHRQIREIQNLFSGVGEWTTSSSPVARQGSFVASPDLRTIRGAASDMSAGAKKNDARHGRILESRFQSRADIGFRCVRSQVPRFLDY